jgi:hypothetical protein
VYAVAVRKIPGINTHFSNPQPVYARPIHLSDSFLRVLHQSYCLFKTRDYKRSTINGK